MSRSVMNLLEPSGAIDEALAEDAAELDALSAKLAGRIHAIKAAQRGEGDAIAFDGQAAKPAGAE